MLKDPVVEDLLKLPNTIIVGSRAFDVHRKDSDLDIAVLLSELPGSLITEVRATSANYFNVLPMGNSFLIRRNKVDILVYKREEDLDILRTCVDLMKYISHEILEVKELRVKIFETLMVNRGFRRVVKKPGKECKF